MNISVSWGPNVLVQYKNNPKLQEIALEKVYSFADNERCVCSHDNVNIVDFPLVEPPHRKSEDLFIRIAYLSLLPTFKCTTKCK